MTKNPRARISIIAVTHFAREEPTNRRGRLSTIGHIYDRRIHGWPLDRIAEGFFPDRAATMLTDTSESSL